ncbi:MAG: DUF4287 domain-containing protein [Caldilineaceae bacterium]
MSEKSERDQKMFQSYLDNIKAKTGKTAEDFRLEAAEKGLVKNGEIVGWLKSDYGLGHGHANAIAHVILSHGQEEVNKEDSIAAHFTGKKAAWRQPYDEIMTRIQQFGADVDVEAGKTYISLLRGPKKFGIVQVSGDRLDLGIKRKDVAPTERFEAAGSWNSMMTHRARISEAQGIDDELLSWLQEAYNAA